MIAEDHLMTPQAIVELWINNDYKLYRMAQRSTPKQIRTDLLRQAKLNANGLFYDLLLNVLERVDYQAIKDEVSDE